MSNYPHPLLRPWKLQEKSNVRVIDNPRAVMYEHVRVKKEKVRGKSERNYLAEDHGAKWKAGKQSIWKCMSRNKDRDTSKGIIRPEESPTFLQRPITCTLLSGNCSNNSSPSPPSPPPWYNALLPLSWKTFNWFSIALQHLPATGFKTSLLPPFVVKPITIHPLSPSPAEREF